VRGVVTKQKVAYVGMTHLGIVSAVAAAAKGAAVIGIDLDADLCARLRAGNLPILEPNLAETLAANRGNIDFSFDFAQLKDCALAYIAADVPTDDAGQSDLQSIRRLIDAVLPALGPQTLLVVLCQVSPGFTRTIPRAADRLFYQVETLVFGNALERALKPERFIVGCADSAQNLPAALGDFLKLFDCPILPMRYESAELAKISINMCLVASVGVANTMAEICEGSGAFWHEIVPALKLDRRIGPYSYLKPGLGIAGGNLERDLATVIRMADAQGADAGIVRAWLTNSRHRRDWAARTIRAELLDAKPNAVVAIWGLAYKEDTHSVKNSPSLATIGQLGNVALRLHDPVVPAAAARCDTAVGCSDAMEALDGADALMILTPWRQYRAHGAAEIAERLKGKLVLDPYQVLDGAAAARAGLRYVTLGAAASKQQDQTQET
jgi:UDPglucose 6-dehydrogenase